MTTTSVLFPNPNYTGSTTSGTSSSTSSSDSGSPSSLDATTLGGTNFLTLMLAQSGDRGAGGESEASGEGGAGGDMHLHFHGPSDGPAVERWFTGLLARQPGVVRNMLRSNALTPRTL